MPTPQTKELQTVSEKEIRLATALKALDGRERSAYKYFVTNEVRGIPEQDADRLYAIYSRGSNCEELRRLFPIYSLGQIVAARVMWFWDERKTAQVKQLQKEVPDKVETVQLETQEFLANLLHAVSKRSNDALRMYIATGEEGHLINAGIALPKTMKELKDLIETYGKVAGTDTKKVQVTHTGQVTHVATTVSAAEAATLMDDLLDNDVIDVTPEPPKQIEAAPLELPDSPAGKIEFLVAGGMERAKAEELVNGK